jgi:hypothetical protein
MFSVPFGGVLPHGRYGVPNPRLCLVLSTTIPFLALSPWKIQRGGPKNFFLDLTDGTLGIILILSLLIAAERACG